MKRDFRKLELYFKESYVIHFKNLKKQDLRRPRHKNSSEKALKSTPEDFESTSAMLASSGIDFELAPEKLELTLLKKIESRFFEYSL